ncbi:RNA polymerase sigma-70 factor (ECF subfamily) [Diaminobutyricimonas aerilata]|uniref:RNA polymerase sigma-70 factor (ECF subfamily) n=1 Tax=Diaminobutyricimonas aerilata TaxID=1162967 RepID=A0A2M9CI71_9MICO|nr:sigma-70 family RNA polymerase sigma factor [Diaminobutyricimonas aerilata]PJJ71601.1 RNA polymerase sigma-70 factor (ECF subfamily) [Diaminobutyricimonas aerilata]
MTSAAVADSVAALHRAEWSRLVAGLIRVTGDWAVAEDCAQEAFETALGRWDADGIPPAPGAWLATVARNRALDRLRRAGLEQRIVSEGLLAPEPPDDVDDDRLRLLFTCCHPALALEARVALTLRTVAGLTTAEIARAFLVSESTMAQRLVRAKAKIAHAGIPFRVPPPELLAERLDGVLAVIYLVFTEGYSATGGDELVRAPLAEQAIRLARLLHGLMPGETEAAGLLALLLLQHARRDARVDEYGDAVTIDAQDRSRWDREAITEGSTLIRRAAREGTVGRYTLQAVIAAAHATAPSWERTDFAAILDAYDALAAIDPSPVVALNRAIAVGMARGPQAGLRAVDTVGDAPATLVAPARARFLRDSGRRTEAAAEYRRALEHTRAAPARRHLEARLRECESEA